MYIHTLYVHCVCTYIAFAPSPHEAIWLCRGLVLYDISLFHSALHILFGNFVHKLYVNKLPQIVLLFTVLQLHIYLAC